MTSFILTINFETVNLECISAVLADHELEAYLEAHAGFDLVFLSIDVSGQLSDESPECIENVLYIPDLTRFNNLEVLWINFDGSVKTSSPDGCLTLPNKVWMFALRNGNLGSNLKFGCLSGQDGSTTTNPNAVIALHDASISGSVDWHTSRGHNHYDMSLMYCTQGNVNLTNVPSATYHESLYGIAMGYDMRGGSRNPTCDEDARIHFMLREFDRYCSEDIHTNLKLMLPTDSEPYPGVEDVIKAFFYST